MKLDSVRELKASLLDQVLPGRYDGGAQPDSVAANLGDFVKLKRTGANAVDAAIFLDEGRQVAKLGRTTGRTRGRVTAFELDNVTVEFDIGALRFDNQIEIEIDGNGPFSDGGDRGSLIVGADRRAVALLFAGSDQGGAGGQGLTYANPIHTVQDQLKIELAL
jgi:hypothetical protein